MITADQYGISHAARPWAEPRKRTREKIYTYDRPAQIERCLSCEKAECDDCLSDYWQKRVPKRVERNKKFIALYESGKTNAEIADVMGATKTTVSYYLKKFGMEPNMAKPKSDPCLSCRSMDICSACGGTCGDKQRFNSD